MNLRGSKEGHRRSWMEETGGKMISYFNFKSKNVA